MLSVHMMLTRSRNYFIVLLDGEEIINRHFLCDLIFIHENLCSSASKSKNADVPQSITIYTMKIWDIFMFKLWGLHLQRVPITKSASQYLLSLSAELNWTDTVYNINW